jgi:hypothetical protein
MNNIAILLGITTPSALVAAGGVVLSVRNRQAVKPNSEEARKLVFDDLADVESPPAPRELLEPEAYVAEGEEDEATPRRAKLFNFSELLHGLGRLTIRRRPATSDSGPHEGADHFEGTGDVEPLVIEAAEGEGVDAPHNVMAAIMANAHARSETTNGATVTPDAGEQTPIEAAVVEVPEAVNVTVGDDNLIVPAAQTEQLPDVEQLRSSAAAEAFRLQQERDMQAAIAEGQARGEAWTQLWWVRLDPDLDADNVRGRRALASSLRRVRGEWALKLARKAIAQEDDATVRARLLGTLHALGETDSALYGAAWKRSDIERDALRELFGDGETPWARLTT